MDNFDNPSPNKVKKQAPIFYHSGPYQQESYENRGWKISENWWYGDSETWYKFPKIIRNAHQDWSEMRHCYGYKELLKPHKDMA